MSSETYQIMVPRIIGFGVGSLSTLADEANTLGVKRVLIITDLGSINLV